MAGVIDSKERRSNFMPGDVLTATIGQGHAITPLQLANYAAIFANGGTHYRPYLVDKAVNSQGKVVYEAKPEVLKTLPYDEKNWEIVRTGMEAVTEIGGTGSVLRTLPVKVAGKTGSAQVSPGKISTAYLLVMHLQKSRKWPWLLWKTAVLVEMVVFL